MELLEMLKSVRFVVDGDGRPSAVQVAMETWEAILERLEDIEDRALLREKIAGLRSGPAKAGALRWEVIKAEWNSPESKQTTDAP
jgi:hypothetical protein